MLLKLICTSVVSVIVCVSAFDSLSNRPLQVQSPFARILSLRSDSDSSGTFSYSYETENGIKAEARGLVNNAGVPDLEEQVISGSFSFVGDNGQVYTVTYTADANGFRAYGDHIPSVPAPPPPPSLRQAPTHLSLPSPISPSPPFLAAGTAGTREANELLLWPQSSEIEGLTPPPPPAPVPATNTEAAPFGHVVRPKGRTLGQRVKNVHKIIVPDWL